MNKKYTDKLLKKVQNIELMILKDFIEVCNKHHLDYFVTYGTALGAIRHKGFIPWDDDIDTGMLREDFKKFELIFEKELGTKYNLVNPVRAEGYGSTVNHMELKGTKFISSDAVNMKYTPGICIDIFVYDKLPSNKLKKQFLYKKAWILGRLTFLASNKEPFIPLKGIKKSIAKNICKAMHIFMNKTGITSKKLYKKLIKGTTKYNSKNGTEFTCLEAPDMVPNTTSYNDMFPLKKVHFEDIEVNIIKNYNKNLTNLFGDYMQMPPEELRFNHRPHTIDFGSY